MKKTLISGLLLAFAIAGYTFWVIDQDETKTKNPSLWIKEGKVM
jgi:hypothetical protein